MTLAERGRTGAPINLFADGVTGPARLGSTSMNDWYT